MTPIRVRVRVRLLDPQAVTPIRVRVRVRLLDPQAVTNPEVLTVAPEHAVNPNFSFEHKP